MLQAKISQLLNKSLENHSACLLTQTNICTLKCLKREWENYLIRILKMRREFMCVWLRRWWIVDLMNSLSQLDWQISTIYRIFDGLNTMIWRWTFHAVKYTNRLTLTHKYWKKCGWHVWKCHRNALFLKELKMKRNAQQITRTARTFNALVLSQVVEHILYDNQSVKCSK